MTCPFFSADERFRHTGKPGRFTGQTNYEGERSRGLKSGCRIKKRAETDVQKTGAPVFSLLEGNTGFEVTTLDDYLTQVSPSPRVDSIKMDIQGFELVALEGARKLAESNNQKLVISLHHRPLDMVEIPLWITQNLPGYRF